MTFSGIEGSPEEQLSFLIRLRDAYLDSLAVIDVLQFEDRENAELLAYRYKAHVAELDALIEKAAAEAESQENASPETAMQDRFAPLRLMHCQDSPESLLGRLNYPAPREAGSPKNDK